MICITYQTAFVPGQRDPIALLHHLTQHIQWSDYLFYEGKDDIRLVFNTHARLELTNEGLLFFDGTQTILESTNDPLKSAERLLAGLPLQGWTAYGYIGFDVARYYSPYTKKIAEPLMAFIIPETELRFSHEGVSIRTMHDINLFKRLLTEDCQLPSYTPEPILLEEGQDRDWYQSRVSALTQKIKEGYLQKAIISRSVNIPGQLDVLGTYTVGARMNSRARSYCFSLGSIQGVGFSPETLLEADGNGFVQTNPLAGTQPRGGTAEEDAYLYNELFRDSKEVKEHVLSIWLAQAEIASVCTPESVRVFDFMNVIKYRCVQHLSSRVSGTLQKDQTTWDALKALFPGITISGIDKMAALEWINRLEEVPRGLYAGALGWIDADGAADLAISIRSVFQYHDRIHLNAGAGIIAESDPRKEYRESVNKMNTMLHSLVLTK
jgi:salicylate synthetase